MTAKTENITKKKKKNKDKKFWPFLTLKREAKIWVIFSEQAVKFTESKEVNQLTRLKFALENRLIH